MAQIFKFPDRKVANGDGPAASTKTAPVASRSGSVWSSVVQWLWLVLVVLWPFLKWPASIFVFVQLMVMWARWDTPGSYAGWSFLISFAALSGIFYLVSAYKPKNG